MFSNVELSIIIPLYNVEAYVSKCIDSIISQNMDGVEIICVDDGSEDNTCGVAKKYCDAYVFIRMVKLNENHGQAYARNVGLQEARGRYVYFMDADDYLSGTVSLKRIIDEAKDDPDGLYFDFRFEYESDQERKQYANRDQITQTFPAIKTTGIDFIQRLLSEDEIWLSVWREIWSREYLINNEIKFVENTSPHEDLLFSFQAISRARSIVYIKRPIYVYYIRSDSSTAGKITKRRHIAHLRCLIEGIRTWRDYCSCEKGSILILYVYYIKRFMKQAMKGLLDDGIDIWNLDGITEYERTVLRLTYLEEYPFLKRIYSLDEYNRIKAAESCIVYGAGKVGSDIFRLNSNLGIDNVVLAASEEKAGEGIQLIDKVIKGSKNSAVVLATCNPCFRKEMIERLDAIGVSDYINLFSEV